MSSAAGSACGKFGIKPHRVRAADHACCKSQTDSRGSNKAKKEIRKQAGLAELHPKQVSAHLIGNLLIATQAVQFFFSNMVIEQLCFFPDPEGYYNHSVSKCSLIAN